MNKIIKIVSFLFVAFGSLSFANSVENSVYELARESKAKLLDYPAQLKNVILKIHQLKEAESLITQAQEFGFIAIRFNEEITRQFEACWDQSVGTIYLSPRHRSEGHIISSIIFEMHNASSAKRFSDLIGLVRAGKIDKESYVRQVEHIEHQNVLSTIRILRSGVEKGIFPSGTKMDVIEDFEVHYKTQQLFGHSMEIAKEFDFHAPAQNRVPYKGTVPNIERLTPKQKDQMLYELTYKRQS